MKKRFLVTMVIVLALIANTALAGAFTGVSRYTGNTYNHNNKFSDYVISNGLDVSIYQHSIDWRKAKANGIDFAIVRVAGRGYASAGTMYKDTTFISNLRNAKAAGVMIGVYFFSQATSQLEAKAEADYTIRLIEEAGYTPKDMDLPVFMDYEFAGGNAGRLTKARLTKSAATAIATAFCERVISLGYKPGIYANLNFLTRTMDGPSLGKKYPIWIAQYNNTCQYYSDYEWWQYSSGGKVDGINARNDCNFWYINPNPQSTVGKYTVDNTSGSSSGLTSEDPLGSGDGGFIGSTPVQPETTPKVQMATKSLVEAQAYIVGQSEFEYAQGASMTPGVRVQHGGRDLVEGVDYKVRYVNNTQVGKGYAMVMGLGDFCDYKLVPFTIKGETDLSKLVIEPITSMRYTGSERKPSKINVHHINGNALIKGLDYTYTVSNAVNPGTATLTVNFIGNYAGTKSVDYKILRAKQEISVARANTSLKVGQAPYNLGVSLKWSGSNITYETTNSSVLSVSTDGTVNVVGKGMADIIIRTSSTDKAAAGKRVISVTVSDSSETLEISVMYNNILNKL